MKWLPLPFWLLSASLLFSQSRADSLLNVLPTLKEDSTKVQTYLQLVDEFYRKDLNRALDYATRAEELSEKSGLTVLLATSKRNVGYLLTNMRKYQQAEKKYRVALKIYLEHNNPAGIMNVKTELGNIARMQSKNEEAFGLFFEALALAQKEGDKLREAGIYSSIGDTYKNQKQFKKAIENYEAALVLVRALDFKPGVSACLTNLANIYTEIRTYEKAIRYHEQALELKKEMADRLGEARVLNSLGIVYNNLKEFYRAENYFKQAHEVAEEVADVNLSYEIEYGLAAAAFGKGDYKQSIKMATDALEKLDSTATLETELKIHRLLSNAYEELKEFEKAHHSAATVIQLSDSFYNEKIVLTTNNLEAKYKNEQKVKEIALLESDKELQSLQLRKRINERNAIIAFALIMLTLAGLLYNQYRIKQKANKKLKELDRLKSNFFANISHEFRTPLTLIKGPIERLEQNPEEKLGMDTIKMIRRNATRVLKLVNQLLDLSKIDEGNLKLEPTEGDVYKCLRAATSSFNSHAAQRNIDYRVHIPQTVLWASFDRDKLEKVLYNLLSNAFKFSEDGSFISFETTYGEQALQMQLADSGKGIPKEDLPFIFDRFYQVDGSSTREKEGSGIGLSLSKDLVELMDGTITVTSELDKGSFFTVHLPIQQIRTGQEESEDEVAIVTSSAPRPEPFELIKEDKRDLPRILLVEDNSDMLHFIKENLIQQYKVTEAANGKIGLKSAIVNPPELIITDLMMPKMDGIELCKKLKTDVHTSHIPVIMLTAKAGMENKMEGLETGADDYLTKPFDGKELLVRTKNLIEQRKKLRELFANKKVHVDPKKVTVTSIDQNFLEQLLTLLEDNYSHGDFGVPQMQEALAMSKSQLHRKLKALTNEAPGELLRNFRLKRAAQLLAQKADTVTQIAYRVGFNDLSYFTKCFKELYGVVPSAYQR
ncbi:hybrid sensor histidine kinase/response regulator transcription factor [Spongiimicrobium sp. 2-473A-2-J]|uniref:hybrid sensor histidine kinase/response regulator transcription factor n=1 Tax=Eudoraea algarum TaxID=3417568 RepID=UPI003D35A709